MTPGHSTGGPGLPRTWGRGFSCDPPDEAEDDERTVTTPPEAHALLSSETVRALEGALPASRRLNELGAEVTGLHHAQDRGWLTKSEQKRFSELRAELELGMAEMEELRSIARRDPNYSAFCERVIGNFVAAEEQTREVEARRHDHAFAVDGLRVWRAEARGEIASSFSSLLLTVSDGWSRKLSDIGPPEFQPG